MDTSTRVLDSISQGRGVRPGGRVGKRGKDSFGSTRGGLEPLSVRRTLLAPMARSLIHGPDATLARDLRAVRSRSSINGLASSRRASAI